ncbi:MAG: hypothetical protein KAH16_06125, partial [Candidatus Izimaplasma sp.]|nr:hypothetical protein [Candidatus Izimaplasma bacterium]
MKIIQKIQENKTFAIILFVSTFLWAFVLALFMITSAQTKTNLITAESEKTKKHYENVLFSILGELSNIEVFVKTIGVDGLTQQSFDKFANNNNFGDIGFVSFSIAPDGVIGYYYSEDYGDDIIGHDLINDDREYVREAVNYAITNKVVVINGPFDLIQGENGLVFRKAIFEDNEFVALINLAIDYNNLSTLLDIDRSEIVSVGIYSKDDNSLLFGDLEYE